MAERGSLPKAVADKTVMPYTQIQQKKRLDRKKQLRNGPRMFVHSIQVSVDITYCLYFVVFPLIYILN